VTLTHLQKVKKGEERGKSGGITSERGGLKGKRMWFIFPKEVKVHIKTPKNSLVGGTNQRGEVFREEEN